MPFRNQVTELAQRIYPKIFCDTSMNSEKDKIIIGDVCSVKMCQEWQTESQKLEGMSLLPEVVVAGNSPIDLVDVKNGIGYELKYSHKNVKDEFYKDMFKIIIYNETKKDDVKICKFVFLCHVKGIRSIEASSLCVEAILFMKKIGIEVHLVELYPDLYEYKISA